MLSVTALTAQLGELLRSALPGYAVSLALHPALTGEPGSPMRAIVIDIARSQLEAVCWVSTNDPAQQPWTNHTVEARVVLRDSERDGAIVDMVGDAVGWDTTPSATTVLYEALDDVLDDVLETLARLIEEDLPAAELEPSAQASLRDGLRIYRNDRFGS